MTRSAAMLRTAPCILLAALALAGAPAARADHFSLRTADWLSGTGFDIYLAAGLLAPFAEDGRAAGNHVLRIADGLLVSGIATEGLKSVVHEERPDHRSSDSFPSAHACAAFLAATVESGFHPGQAPLWYAGATLIGASRVRLHEHFVHDVVAGALIGYGVGRWEMSRRRGILLVPIIPRGGAGLAMSAAF